MTPPAAPPAAAESAPSAAVRTVRADVHAEDLAALRTEWACEDDGELVRLAVEQAASILRRRREFFHGGGPSAAVGGTASNAATPDRGSFVGADDGR